MRKVLVLSPNQGQKARKSSICNQPNHQTLAKLEAKQRTYQKPANSIAKLLLMHMLLPLVEFAQDIGKLLSQISAIDNASIEMRQNLLLPLQDVEVFLRVFSF